MKLKSEKFFFFSFFLLSWGQVELRPAPSFCSNRIQYISHFVIFRQITTLKKKGFYVIILVIFKPLKFFGIAVQDRERRGSGESRKECRRCKVAVSRRISQAKGQSRQKVCMFFFGAAENSVAFILFIFRRLVCKQ